MKSGINHAWEAIMKLAVKDIDVISQRNFRRLLQDHPAPCVTLTMPTARKGPETQQNAIRFKNLLREAEDKLSSFQLRTDEAQKLLAPAVELQDDAEFWMHQ